MNKHIISVSTALGVFTCMYLMSRNDKIHERQGRRRHSYRGW